MGDLDDATTEISQAFKGGKGPALAAYILYLAGFVIPIAPLIGLVIAYLKRPEAPDWIAGHYTFLIRTFWIGLLGSVVGGLLSLILVGYLVLLAVVVWMVVRCVKGIFALNNDRGIANPESWMVGD